MNQPPNFCCSECADRVLVTIRSPRRRIAERSRWPFRASIEETDDTLLNIN